LGANGCHWITTAQAEFWDQKQTPTMRWSGQPGRVQRSIELKQKELGSAARIDRHEHRGLESARTLRGRDLQPEHSTAREHFPAKPLPRNSIIDTAGFTTLSIVPIEQQRVTKFETSAMMQPSAARWSCERPKPRDGKRYHSSVQLGHRAQTHRDGGSICREKRPRERSTSTSFRAHLQSLAQDRAAAQERVAVMQRWGKVRHPGDTIAPQYTSMASSAWGEEEAWAPPRCVPHPVPGSNVGHPARPTPECTPPGTIARLLHPAPVRAFDNAAMQHPPELPMAPRPPKAFDRTSLGIPL